MALDLPGGLFEQSDVRETELKTSQETTNRYVDRGDPASNDFIQTNLTTDGTWRDLDLSSIIPSGAIAAHITVIVNDGAIGSNIRFRKNGNSNENNVMRNDVSVSNQFITNEGIITLDDDRKIEYNATNTVWTNISIVVKGWFA